MYQFRGNKFFSPEKNNFLLERIFFLAAKKKFLAREKFFLARGKKFFHWENKTVSLEKDNLTAREKV